MEEKVVTEQAAKSLRGRKDNTYRTKMPLKRRIAVHWENYLMMVPVVVFYLIFAYFPMYGIVIAFKEYYPTMGLRSGVQSLQPRDLQCQRYSGHIRVPHRYRAGARGARRRAGAFQDGHQLRSSADGEFYRQKDQRRRDL